MRHKAKKFISKLFIIAASLILIVPNAYAIDSIEIDGYGDPLDPMNTILDDLGVDKDELRYSVQTMNVARQKKSPPQVSLTFEPTNPKPGEKVTVVAAPTNFLNDPGNLYFTWFLKMDDCDKTNTPDAKISAKCDLNEDTDVDIEDWKIKAARIIANDDFDWENEKSDYDIDSDNDGYRAVYGGDDQRDKEGHCFIHDTSSGDEYEIGCAHLFPKAKNFDTGGYFDTGDNSFERGEEKFWRTDPTSNDTAHTGNVDEANVAGRGINSFTWNYSAGDKVGVAVEGVSFESAQTSDASYRTMWAMPKSMCDVEVKDVDYPKTSTETISATPDTPIAGRTTTITHTTTESVLSRAANIATIRTTVTEITTVITTATGAQVSQSSTVLSTSDSVEDISGQISIDGIDDASDLNECLYDNLISPAENGPASDKLEVSLSYSPDSPINDKDATSKAGDELVVQSSITNPTDSNYVQYTWEVFMGDEANPEKWGDSWLKKSLPEATQMTGLGLDTFKLKLNFPNPRKYLRIKLTVNESVGEGLSREGHTDVVIPINSSSDKISAYKTSAYKNSADNSIWIKSENEMCGSGLESVVCPVSQNEIVGLKVNGQVLTDYLWTIDGKPFAYQECFFDECKNSTKEQFNMAYFPILKEKGERYTVNLIATNKNNGEKTNLTRVFEVVDPEINISSKNDDCKKVLLGSYIGLDGKEYPDYSENNYWALAGSAIKLSASSGGFSVSPEKYIWTVNGDTFDSSSAASFGYSLDSDGTLTLPSKNAGEIYDVSVGAVYSQDNLVKKALNDYWDVTYDQFFEKMVGNNIVITAQDSAPLIAQSSSTGRKIFAAAYSALPSYLAFLFRIVLSAFLILFVSGFVMSFKKKEYIE